MKGSLILATFTAILFPIIASDETSVPAMEVIKDQMTMVFRKITQLQNNVNEIQNKSTTMKPQRRINVNVFRDCNEYYLNGYTKSGVYTIFVFHGFYPLHIYCDMETTGAFSGKRGWITIQRRTNGFVTFDRGWNDYVHGFGFPHEEHWVGLKNFFNIADQMRINKYTTRNLVLRIDLEDWDGITGFMEHDSFSLLSEDSDFAISTLGKYKGTTGLSAPLEFSFSSRFSTYDHNNDRRRSKDCINKQKGGWWFGYCKDMNLNGVYSRRKEVMTRNKIFIRNWGAVNPQNTGLRYISIKLQ